MSPGESHQHFDPWGGGGDDTPPCPKALLFIHSLPQSMSSFDPRGSPRWEQRMGKAMVTYYPILERNVPRRRSPE